MGMAASQARLLSLTARLHDVELKAQNVMSQKIALATQKDGLYKEYCEALEATNFKVAFRNDDASSRLVDANYNSVCTYNADRMHQLYALRDNNTGNIIVSQEVATAYKEYGNDKYAFAYAMLGFGGNFAWNEGRYSGAMGGEVGIGRANVDYGFPSVGGTGNSCFMTQVEQLVYDENVANDPDLAEKYQAILDAAGNDGKQSDALEDFREYLYQEYSEQIFEKMNLNKNRSMESTPEVDFPDLTWKDIQPEFNYYVNLWSAINDAGGCQVVDAQYTEGEQGNTWFQNMLETGLATLMAYNISGHKNEWTDTSVATSTNNNYLQEVSDDLAVKKAEAKYEHELGILNRKDTKFDTELSNLETERKAITTEMDSIKQVRDDNVDRTFGIFS